MLKRNRKQCSNETNKSNCIRVDLQHCLLCRKYPEVNFSAVPDFLPCRAENRWMNERLDTRYYWKTVSFFDVISAKWEYFFCRLNSWMDPLFVPPYCSVILYPKNANEMNKRQGHGKRQKQRINFRALHRSKRRCDKTSKNRVRNLRKCRHFWLWLSPCIYY